MADPIQNFVNNLGSINAAFEASVKSLTANNTELTTIQTSLRKTAVILTNIDKRFETIGKNLGAKFSDLGGKVTSLVTSINNATNNLAQPSQGQPQPNPNNPQNPSQQEDLSQLYFNLQTLTGGMGLIKDSIQSFNSIITESIPTFDSVKIFTGSISQANAALASMPMQLDSVRMQLLGLGTSLDNFEKDIGPQIDGLVGDRLKNVENAANLFSQGFRGSNRGLLDVAAKLDITGQKTAALTNEFPKLSVLMQLNNNGMNDLAGSLFNTAQTFSVKTEDLIKVIGKLQNLEVMSTLGFGGEFANNLKDLAAKYKMGEDQIVKLTNALTNPAALQGLAKADPAILGLVSKLEQANGPAEFESTFKEIVTRLNSFTQMLANQSKGTGLPSTVVAQQLIQQFGMDLTTASQLTKVFTDRLSESEKQLQREKDLTDSLNASIQELKTAILPVVKIVADFAKSVVQGSGFYILLATAGIKVISSLATQVVSYASLKISIDRTSRAFDAATRNMLAAGQNVGRVQRGVGNVLGSGFFGSIAPLLGLAGPIGMGLAAATAFLPMLLGGNEDKEDATLEQIKENTGITAKNTEPEKLIPQRTSIYSTIAKDMADMLTMRETFNNRVLQVLTDTKDSTDRMSQVYGLYTSELIKVTKDKASGSRPR